MCDDVERAQDIAQHFIDSSLRDHFAARKQPRSGRSTCIECEEPITPTRKALGADLCIDCQRDEDLRSRMGRSSSAVHSLS